MNITKAGRDLMVFTSMILVLSSCEPLSPEEDVEADFNIYGSKLITVNEALNSIKIKFYDINPLRKEDDSVIYSKYFNIKIFDTTLDNLIQASNFDGSLGIEKSSTTEAIFDNLTSDKLYYIKMITDDPKLYYYNDSLKMTRYNLASGCDVGGRIHSKYQAGDTSDDRQFTYDNYYGLIWKLNTSDEGGVFGKDGLPLKSDSTSSDGSIVDVESYLQQKSAEDTSQFGCALLNDDPTSESLTNGSFSLPSIAELFSLYDVSIEPSGAKVDENLFPGVDNVPNACYWASDTSDDTANGYCFDLALGEKRLVSKTEIHPFMLVYRARFATVPAFE